MKPTDEQTSIIAALKSTPTNLIINALAGTGKTSTLQLIEQASPGQPILYLAFNRRIADEASKKFTSTTLVRTLNGLGHRVWQKTQSNRLNLNPKKTQDIFKAILEAMPKPLQPTCREVYWDVIEGVSKAKIVGYIPEGTYTHVKALATKAEFIQSLDEIPDDLTCDLIDATLTESIKQSYLGTIDFADQIYMPTLFGGTFPSFPLVLGDEAQDFSPINHRMLRRVVSRGTRLVAVGDPWQSIYAFRGAVQSGMEKISERFGCNGFPLSLSFRCPEAIVNHVKGHVPHFRWTKAGGKVEVLKALKLEEIHHDCAILCRNNAPLYHLALRLLREGRSVSVAGSELGPKIMSIMRKFGDDCLSQSGVLGCISAWCDEKATKSSKSAIDTADCMRVFASYGTTLGGALAYAKKLFDSKGTIRLLTGHKAKGLEWPLVYHLDPWLIGKHEKSNQSQEENLRYVISTRAQETLYEINSARIT